MSNENDLQARILRDTEYGMWENWIYRQSHVSIYQSREWSTVLKKVFGYGMRYIGIFRQGVLCGGLPAYLVSDPFFGRKLVSVPHDAGSGFLCAEDSAGEKMIAGGLLDLGLAEKVRHIEIRTTQKLPLPSPFKCQQPLLLAELELHDIDILWKQMDAKTRNKIRQSEQKGVSVTKAVTLQEVCSFYEILLDNFQQFGNPCLPLSYFTCCLEHLGDVSCRFLTAYHEDALIAGILLLAAGDTVVYKIGAARAGSMHLRPYNILIWEGIRWARSKGYRYFSFGSTDPENHGLIRFKKGFGAEIFPLYFFCAPVLKKEPDYSGLFSSRTLARRVWRLMPKSIAGPLGGRLRRWYC